MKIETRHSETKIVNNIWKVNMRSEYIVIEMQALLSLRVMDVPVNCRVIGVKNRLIAMHACKKSGVPN